MDINDRIKSVIESSGTWPILSVMDRSRPRRPIPLATVSPHASLGTEHPYRVSVIIPCFNYGHFLEAATESAIKQPGVEVDVIIVDDASTDDSLSVAEALAATRQNVQVVRNRTNTGHVVAFNNGLEHATGELIVRLDADDLLTPGSLSRAAALFQMFPSIGLVYGHPRHFASAEPPAPRVGDVSWTIWEGSEWLAARCRAGVNCITTPEAVIRASVLHEVGPLDTRLRFAQDMEMWLRVASFSDVGRVNGVDQALHRDHAASMSVTDAAGLMTDLSERREVFRVLFDTARGWLPNADELHAIARETLAREALRHATHDYDRGRANPELEAQLVQFAGKVFPDWADLPEARSLARRKRLGPALSRWNPMFAGAALSRRVRTEMAYLRWVHSGV